ncbi:hypothetical protein FHU33_0552 [Blastococcus colisei]|uniref:Uncharacterized protein n=1 Tax=Blastococcus colisei TaxID=1564162 RepID=A0A543PAT4_9ACTN|nr:hypothetical protein FHU33_0552 [Blastococcus colisei]
MGDLFTRSSRGRPGEGYGSRMSMMPPPFSADPSDEGIPAADPGAGAPPPAPGYGEESGEPDVLLPEDGPSDDARVTERDETTFRTPDPREVGPDDER